MALGGIECDPTMSKSWKSSLILTATCRSLFGRKVFQGWTCSVTILTGQLSISHCICNDADKLHAGETCFKLSRVAVGVVVTSASPTNLNTSRCSSKTYWRLCPFLKTLFFPSLVGSFEPRWTVGMLIVQQFVVTFSLHTLLSDSLRLCGF